jgi:hypothetical protein
MTKKTAAQKAAEKVAQEETADEAAAKAAEQATAPTAPVGNDQEQGPASDVLTAQAATASPSPSPVAAAPASDPGAPSSEWEERNRVLAAGRRGKHRRDNYTSGGWPEREKHEKVSKLERENADLRRRLEEK